MGRGIKILIDKDRLIDLYLNQNKTIPETAKELNCGHTSIIRYLKKYNITKPLELKHQNVSRSNRRIDHQKLIDDYLVNKMLTPEIAKKYNTNVSSVARILSDHNVDVDDRYRQYRKKVADDNIPYKDIIELYINQNKTALEVANILKISEFKIRKCMDKIGTKKTKEMWTKLNTNKDTQWDLLKNPEWFYQKYISENKTIIEVAKEAGSTIRMARLYRIKYGFKKSTEQKGSFLQKNNSNVKDKEWLYQKYIVENTRIIEIAEQENISMWLVEYYIHKFNLHKSHALKRKLRIETNISRGNQTCIFGQTIDELAEQYKLSHSFTWSLFKRNSFSTYEELHSFLAKISIDRFTSLELYTNKLLGLENYNQKAHLTLNYKPDFKISDILYLNVDGLYWHCEKEVDDSYYHFTMRQKYEELGLQILQFRENDIYKNPEIVKSIVNNKTNTNIATIYGRKTEIKEVKTEDAKEFLTRCHLKGYFSGKHIGLYYNGNLKSVLSYKIYDKNTLKVERFCTDLNTRIIGGFSKLLKYLERNESFKEVYYWVDLKYGTGKFLEQLGFQHSHDTLGWEWTDKFDTFNRRRCRANMDERKLKEREYANELKWYKIYDAGQRLFVRKYVQTTT
ncbi:MAG TPA: hypothetical protein VI911_11905 [Patescibacteria group bacterium]|nr:hypothetical protein [Patescibacteria group bacterium]